MATMTMICDEELGGCGHKFEEFRWPSEGEPPLCPQCGCENGKGLRQNWMLNRPNGLCMGEDHATTFGQQSKYNEKRRSKCEDGGPRKPRKRNVEGMPGAKVIEPSTEIPWWRDGSIQGVQKLDRPLDLRNVQNTERYIQTGKMV